MFDEGLLVDASDPDFVAKAAGLEIFVWGGGPTAAQAAEYAAISGGRADLFGDTRPGRADWQEVLREHEQLTRLAEDTGELPPALARRRDELQQLLDQAHSGRTVRRNTVPGAAYANERVRIDYGTPTRITATPDGRVAVAIGDSVRVYDKVVTAHGHVPDTARLGVGAEQIGVDAKGRPVYGEVPADSVHLMPVLAPDGTLLHLETQLGERVLGAAMSSPRLAPWIPIVHRQTFLDALDSMKQPDLPTRDGKISRDSTGVVGGIEHQRDKIVRANERLGAKTYRLPGPEHTLVLDGDPATWPGQIATYFAINLRIKYERITVTHNTDGKSGDRVYLITVSENAPFVFKLFKNAEQARTEREMLRILGNAKLTAMKPVGERGSISLRAGQFQEGVLMDAAPGRTIKQMIASVSSDPAQREHHIKELKVAYRHAARGLAEFHYKFGSAGDADLMHDVNYGYDKHFSTGADATRAAFGDTYDLVKTRAAALKARLAGVKLPATAYLGDTNAGNFAIDSDSNVGFFDVNSMAYSRNKTTGRFDKSGAADFARILGSLETMYPGRLSDAEVKGVCDAFFDEYKRHGGDHARIVDDAAFKLVVRWYRLELELMLAVLGDTSANQRILKLIEEEP
jgi:hypothetical protein